MLGRAIDILTSSDLETFQSLKVFILCVKITVDKLETSDI